MTAFGDDLLRRRDARGRRSAAVRHRLGRAFNWVIALVASLLVVFMAGGFAQGGDAIARAAGAASFRLPWDWLPAVLSGVEPMARLTGVALTLFVGGWTAAIGLTLVRRLLGLELLAPTPLGGMLTVARAGLDEAVRNRTVVVLLTLMLLALAVQPYLTLGSIDQPLRNSLRFTLTFGGFVAAMFLGGVTIFLAAAGVAGDLDSRRAGNVFVKPIPRSAYLVGRWLGTAAPMLVFVVVWAVVAWFVATVWLSNQRAFDPADREFIDTRVLVARAESRAMPDDALLARVQAEVNRIRREDPDRVARQGLRQTRDDVFNAERTGFLAVPFNETRAYVFGGLGEARRRAVVLDEQLAADGEAVAAQLNAAGIAMRPGQVGLATVLPYGDILGRDLSDGRLQLRFSVRGSNTYGATEGELLLQAGGGSRVVRYVVDRVQVFDLPATLVGEDGRLELSITNGGILRGGERREQAIQFEVDNWINIYANQGTFAGNVARQAVVLWVRLAFLAMLATALASLLSFPVAATASLAVWLLAAGGAWLQRTLSSGIGSLGDAGGVAGDAVATTLLPAAIALASLMGDFSRVGGIGLLSDGLYLAGADVLRHVLVVGGLWTGMVFVVTWWLFGRREIARVQV